MNFREKLFSQKLPYHHTDKIQQLFTDAVRENCQFQYENCSEYRKILEYFQFSPTNIKTWEDLPQIPFLPTSTFKKHHIFSIKRHKALFQATSSGTKGYFSQIRFEASALLCGLKMVRKVCGLRKLCSIVPSHYIILGYKPSKEHQAAAAKTAFGATFFTPALSRTYALKTTNGKHSPDFDSLIRRVLKHSRGAFPQRFVGFPSYTYFMLKHMEEQGICLHLPKGSNIMLGGGWKQFYSEQVDKKVLYELAYKVLGIEEEQIIEFFSAVEHPILYCDCINHHFHIPIYSHVMIRDVHTLQPLEQGQIGLVNLITPMVKATPIVSIMTDDLGVLHPADTCSCGNASPYLEIIGRVGLTDIKTCAAEAAELFPEVNS